MPTTPLTPVADGYAERDIQVRRFTSAGQRQFVRGQIVRSISFNKESIGNYTDFTLVITAQNIDDLLTRDGWTVDQIIEIWVNGKINYRGRITTIAPSEEEPTNVTVSGFGMIVDLQTVICNAYLIYPSATDISVVCADLISTVAGKTRTTFITDLQVVGVTIKSFDARGKTCFDALRELVDYAKFSVRFGVDVNADGFDRIFLRPIDITANATPTKSIALQNASVIQRSLKLDNAGLYNAVLIRGNSPLYPQLIPNGSFEVVQQSTAGAGNIVRNPSFETAGAYWTLTAGATMNYGDVRGTTARTGSGLLLLDHTNEKAVQRVAPPITIGTARPYTFACSFMPEYKYNVLNAPVLQIKIAFTQLISSVWTVISGTEQTFLVTAQERTWTRFQRTVAAPDVSLYSNNVGISIELMAYGGAISPSSGVCVDDVECYAADAFTPADWELTANGDAQIQVETWAGQPYHGHNALELQCVANDTSWTLSANPDIPVSRRDIVLTRGALRKIDVVPGQVLSFNRAFRTLDTAANEPSIRYHAIFYDSQNNFISPIVEHLDTGVTAVQNVWETYDNPWNFTVPATAATMVFEVRFVASGHFAIDALSLRNSLDYSQQYIPEGNLELYLTAEGLISSVEDQLAYDSVLTYGRRETLLDTNSGEVSNLTTLAKSYLLRASKLIPSGSITLSGIGAVYEIWDIVKFLGQWASHWPVVPITKIAYSITDVQFHQTIELERSVPTLEDLFGRLMQSDISIQARLHNGAGGVVNITGGTQVNLPSPTSTRQVLFSSDGISKTWTAVDEQIDDRVAALLVAGSHIQLTYDDAGNALTIAVVGIGASTTRWVPLTDGDDTAPQLIFASGEVISVEELI